MKTKTTQARLSGTLDPFVRLGRGLEYALIIQRGKGRNAEFIAGIQFADNPTLRELRQWRDAIQRGIAGVHVADNPTLRELRQWRDAIQRGIEPNTSRDAR